ncbi:LOW QUALITY PROTEIN: hypothetical protein Cgig2_007789 [Carnegiea gigantea]|uniref:Uncharacterized protein n=1 Tax=Carnegiea gigantea TaxID=171969 RepID=A0A9Q1GXC9_9CARY|nr:LOW QUALITY PROTEIN: hypothetical protein Cgig2_007789 [Carnegiea gigantea]
MYDGDFADWLNKHIATASPVPSQNARGEAQQDPLLGKKKWPQSSSRVIGVIEPQKAAGPNQHEVLSEEEENNDATLGSIQVEKFTINEPKMRKEFILKHMNALYRAYRRKLKAKYYDDLELTNSYQRENNKPRKTTKPVNKEKLANNVDAVSKLEDYMKQRNEGLNQMDDEGIFKKEKHGYLRAYGCNKSITDHFGVKPTRLNLIHKVVEIEKKADEQETTRKMEEKMEEKLAERDKLLAECDKMWEERFKKLCDSLGVPKTNQIPQNEST